mmetsp:Transcript_7698/g.20965  ORF Transcript_7698/g.20965 Transcript_7698/m.20965 type:complete len:227 (-) Transcript_7698:1418-2098(-)
MVAAGQIHPSQGFQKRGFAGPRRSHDRNKVSPRRFEVDVVKQPLALLRGVPEMHDVQNGRRPGLERALPWSHLGHGRVAIDTEQHPLHMPHFKHAPHEICDIQCSRKEGNNEHQHAHHDDLELTVVRRAKPRGRQGTVLLIHAIRLFAERRISAYVLAVHDGIDRRGHGMEKATVAGVPQQGIHAIVATRGNLVHEIDALRDRVEWIQGPGATGLDTIANVRDVQC